MAAKPGMSINLGLQPVPQTESPELYNALMPLYNAVRNLGYGVDAYTGNANLDSSEYSQVNSIGQLLLQKTAVMYVRALEDISAGHVVSIANSSGVAVARKAAGNTYYPHAFAADSAAAGQHLPICFFGLCTFIGGLTPGVEYHLSGTAGLLTPTTTYRRVGVALGTNYLWFNPQQRIYYETL